MTLGRPVILEGTTVAHIYSAECPTMPTYEYACRDCGEHLEVVQGFKDAALTQCGRCGGQLRKVFSAAGIIFKGSGYYVTDSRKPAPSTASKSSDDSSGSGSKDTSTKTDAAPSTDSSSSAGSSSSDSSANSA